MAAAQPAWRNPRPRPEQRPTVNVAAIGIGHCVPRLHQHGPNQWSLEIVRGLAIHGTPVELWRLINDARDQFPPTVTT